MLEGFDNTAPVLWDQRYVETYQGATYTPAHRQRYLQRRCETLAALIGEMRLQADPRPLRVLEAACGPGLSLRYLTGLAPTDVVTGIDMAPSMLRLAQSNLSDAALPARLAQASAKELPFPDDAFDFVYATRFIHLFRSKKPVVSELLRVTRPGGLVAIEFYGRPFHLFSYVGHGATQPLGEYLYHYPTMREVHEAVGADAQFLPLRLGGERTLCRALSERSLRRLLHGAWRWPLRLGVAEYLAVITKRRTNERESSCAAA
jgi:SAM-dependent methyltransferase